MSESGGLRRSWRLIACAAIAAASLGVVAPSPATATNTPDRQPARVVADVPTCDNPGLNGAAIFADVNYGGACVALGAGDYPLAFDLNPVGNDNAQSVRLGARASITLCQDEFFAGGCVIFTADAPDLDETDMPGNVASSVHVVARSCSPGAGEIALFADVGYGGACAALASGVYDSAAGDFGKVGNDNAESVQIGSGAALTLCQDTSMAGTCATMASDVPDLATIAVGRNAATSASVAPLTCSPAAGQVSIFAGINYGGACVTLGSGEYEWAAVDFGAVGNDNADSVKAGSGVLLTLCSDGGFEGTCVTIDRDVPDLATTVIDRNSASSATVAAACVPGPGEVSIFADVEYAGACETLAPGYYAWADTYFAVIGNDNAESVKVGTDASLYLCGDAYLLGSCATIVSDTPDLNATSVPRNVASSASVQVSWPDVTPPTAAWDEPPNGAAFTSWKITLSAHAADTRANGLTVEFWASWSAHWTLIGQTYSRGGSAYPSIDWDPCLVGAPSGDYQLRLVARDAGGNSFTTDGLWITRTYDCSATAFDVTAPATWAAGAGNSVTVTARDGSGNVATGYRGTVHFTSSDTKAVLPADYTFVAEDRGVHTFTPTLKTAGRQAIRARDTVNATVTGLRSGITVTPGPAVSLRVAGAAASVAGTMQNVTVTALDAYGNTATGYTGTVHFTSTDSSAALAPDHAFGPADAGVHEFPAVLKKAGTQAIRARDTVTATITGLKSGIAVAPAAAATLRVVTVASTVAGTTKTITVTALDPYGNTATGYRGRVHFTSTDTKAALPADYTFVAGDAGVHTFSVTLKTAGTQVVRGRDTVTATITGVTSGVVVSPAAAATLKVTGPSPWAAGTAQTVTVTALDAYGNTATGYVGTVHFTSTDTRAVLPADHAFAAGDHGVHTFSITLRTAGTQAIRARDTVTATITGLRSGIVVS